MDITPNFISPLDAYMTKELTLEWREENDNDGKKPIEAMDNIKMPEFELSSVSAEQCPKNIAKYTTGLYSRLKFCNF